MTPNDLVGIGSYAFRYAARKKETPMNAIAFIEETARIGLRRALICENLNYRDSDDEYIKKLAETAAKNGITIEIGMRGCSKENIQRHISIANMIGAKLIRIVLGNVSETHPKDTQMLKSEALDSIISVIPQLEKADLYLGIENHFDLTTLDLIDLVSRINNNHIGLIFDTTNCLGLIEKPLDVLETMGRYLLSVHLKDYECRKTDGGYVFSGIDLGDGMLDIASVIQKARSFNPRASFILESNMTPPMPMPETDILLWERKCIEKNMSAIMDAVGKYGV